MSKENKNLKLLKNILRESEAGFTLIEIMLSIAIIAILAAFVFVTIDPAKKLGDAKDARRLNDAETIKQAINDYISTNHNWPPEIAALDINTPYAIRANGTANPGRVSCRNILDQVYTVALNIMPDYLPVLPSDPDGGYYYLIRTNNDIKVAACSTYSNSLDINNGLVSLWHFNESSWTGAGNEVTDSVGSHHGTKSGTASTTPDSKWGVRGGFFNNGLITISADAAINPSNFSIGYWFKNTTDQTHPSVPRITARTAAHFETAVTDNYGVADNKSIYIYRSGAWTDTTYDADPNEWHYYVWTYNGTTVKLYVDGVEEYTVNGSVTISATDAFYIGNILGAGEGVVGNIDEVSLWSRALSQAEAAYIYNLQK